MTVLLLEWEDLLLLLQPDEELELDGLSSSSSSQSSSNNASATYGQAQLGKGFWAFLFGGTTNSVQSSSNRDVESKSLTVIITYNNDKLVSDFTYQSLKY